MVNFAPTIQPAAAPGVTVVNQVSPTPIQNTVNVPPAEPFTEAELTTDKDGKKILRAKRK